MKVLKFLTILVILLNSPFNSWADDDRLRATGFIANLTDSSLTLHNDLTFSLTENTEYEDSADMQITLDQFMAGDLVKVKYVVGDADELLALEVELEDVDDDSMDDDDSSNSDDDSMDDDDSMEDGDGPKDRPNKKKGNGKKKAKPKKVTRVRIRGNFAPVDGVDTSATARIKYHRRTKRKRTEAEFNFRFKLPLPSVTPEVTDEPSAEAQEFSLQFSREGVPYAECNIPFKSISDDSDDSAAAQYRNRIKSRERAGKSPRLKAKFGSECDTDLIEPGVQNGVPEIESGDRAVVSEATSGELLEALF